jgi:hypothetical protein
MMRTGVAPHYYVEIFILTILYEFLGRRRILAIIGLVRTAYN